MTSELTYNIKNTFDSNCHNTCMTFEYIYHVIEWQKYITCTAYMRGELNTIFVRVPYDSCFTLFLIIRIWNKQCLSLRTIAMYLNVKIILHVQVCIVSIAKKNVISRYCIILIIHIISVLKSMYGIQLLKESWTSFDKLINIHLPIESQFYLNVSSPR